VKGVGILLGTAERFSMFIVFIIRAFSSGVGVCGVVHE